MSQAHKRILEKQNFNPETGWICLRSIDLHTAGEPLRVILNGFPRLQGTNVLEYRRYIRDRHDELRRALMHEPRGHADMYGCLLLPPNKGSDADFGVLFLHNEGYSTMCGHAIIAIVNLALKMKWVDIRENALETPISIDAPCGNIRAFCRHDTQGKIQGAYFHGVPSFVVGLDLLVNIPNIGSIKYDLAYGGAFYAYVNAKQLGLELTAENYSRIIELGKEIKNAVINSSQPIQHPMEEDLSFLYGTIFVSDSSTPGVHSRNVCVFADGEVDRSPTGSGVSGRLAIHYKRGELDIGETMAVESITGSVFQGSVVREEKYYSYQAIIPRVEGTAFVTGQHEFLIDPDDPFRHGFFLR
jgi:proline racemase